MLPQPGTVKRLIISVKKHKVFVHKEFKPPQMTALLFNKNLEPYERHNSMHINYLHKIHNHSEIYSGFDSDSVFIFSREEAQQQSILLCAN